MVTLRKQVSPVGIHNRVSTIIEKRKKWLWRRNNRYSAISTKG